MTINNTEIIKTLKGDPYKGDDGDLTVGLALSTVLQYATEGGKYKMGILAEKFYKNAKVEVDDADLSLIRSAVEKTEVFNNNFMLSFLLDKLEKPVK